MHVYICVAYVCMFVWWLQDKRLCVSSDPIHLLFLRKAGTSLWTGPCFFSVSASPVLELKEPATTSSCFKTLILRLKLTHTLFGKH